MNSVWWMSLAALGLVKREQAGEQLTVNQEGRCTSIVRYFDFPGSVNHVTSFSALFSFSFLCVRLSEKFIFQCYQCV